MFKKNGVQVWRKNVIIRPEIDQSLAKQPKEEKRMDKN